MKRLILVLLLFGIMIYLLGCSKPNQIKIMAPQGSPELAVTYLKSHADYHVDVVIGADPLLAAFSSQTHEVIIAPTHLGAKLYASDFDYIMLGIVVFGNYYFASQSQQLNDLNDIYGKEVVIFGQNQTSDIIVKHLFNQFEVEATITYVDSVATANAMLILNPELIILTAEPSLSTLMKSYPNLKILSLEPYYQRLEGQTYPQASVFVKSSLSTATMKQIELDFIEATTKLNEDVNVSADFAINQGLTMEKEVLTSAIPRSHIEYHNAFESKVLIETYLLMIYMMNPALVINPQPDDAFYYRGG